LAARDGTVWISGNQTLTALRQERTPNIAAQRTPGNQVTSLLEDHAGRLWVGIDDFLTIYKDGKFRRIDKPDGKPIGLIVGMTEDVEHNIWAETGGSARTLFRIQDFKVQERFPSPQMPAARKVTADPEGGIWLGLISGDLARYRGGKHEIFRFKHGAAPSRDTEVNQLLVTSDGAVLGATNFGLIAWKHGTQRTLTVRNGLPCDRINSLIEDNQGNLWLSSECGLVEIPKTELQKWWQQPDTIVQFDILDSLDGFLPDQVPFEGAAKSPDGRLWFANGAVLQMIDPAHTSRNLLPPPVHIEEVIADRRTYAPSGNLRLPPITRDLEIDYTALSFMAPQKVRFRYRLEGQDVNWQEPGTRRQAFYSDLPPRKYRFHVIACNNDGVWNEEGAALDFSVAPAWYQTIWFLLLCMVTVGCLAWAAYRWRVRHLATRLEQQFQERLAERTRIAQDLHDTLLQGFISASMQLGVANLQLPSDWAAKPMVTDVLKLMRDVIDEGRKAVRGMRLSSGDSDDLERAFSGIPEELAVPGAVSFRVLVEGEVRPLHPLIRDEIYRIGREALVNAFRHSQAASIEVELEYTDREVRVIVRDNGCGIDPQILQSGRDGHWGLSGMRERAGSIGARLKVWSDATAGTEVELSVPSRIAFRTDGSRRGLRRLGRLRLRREEEDARKPGNER
jgi:signal transduction histidine kinase